MIEIDKPPKPLRSGSQSMIVVKKNWNKGGRKFYYAATTLWNDLHSTDLKKRWRLSLVSRGN